MTAAGIVGGLVHVRMSSPARQAPEARRQWLAAALLALVPAALFVVSWSYHRGQVWNSVWNSDAVSTVNGFEG